MPKSFEQISAHLGVPVAELERYARDVDAKYSAMGDPLPGPLADAYPIVTRRVAGIPIRPVVGSDIPVLRKIDSPVIRAMREAAKPAATRQPTATTDEEGWELILLFTRTPSTIAPLIAEGPAAFRKAAIEQIGDRLNPGVIIALVRAIDEQIGESFKTAQSYIGTDDEKTKPPPAQPTASDGGSTTAPSSKSNAVSRRKKS